MPIIDSNRPGDLDNGGLADGISRAGWKSRQSGDRSNVHNDTAASLQHGWQYTGAKPDDGAEVDFKDVIGHLGRGFVQRGRLRAARCTGIVDQHLRRAKALYSLT
jgi:hypothetical protein